jgi:uncharacterized protein with GYD domain
MATYVLLTKLSPDALRDAGSIEELYKQVKTKIETNTPNIRWTANYALVGPYDYLDIFEAPDDLTATKVATIIRSFGHAATEMWEAIPWQAYRGMVATIR